MNYREPVDFSAVIVHDRDNHCVAERDLNDRPLCPERFVVATVHPCHRVGWIRLYDGEMHHLVARC